jgi:anti-sigma factor RsiW
MADRQDIDALMVGALYGELDAADRARLEAHLSSHPEDRAELEALERTRAAVRRGLAELPAAEPPPSIAATLLAAAAAPRARDLAVAAAGAEPGGSPPVTAAEPPVAEAIEGRPGAWARLLAWLRPVALHPAFAGAAALVLVGGAALAMWARDGETAEPRMARAPVSESSAPPAEPGMVDKQAEGAGAEAGAGGGGGGGGGERGVFWFRGVLG